MQYDTPRTVVRSGEYRARNQSRAAVVRDTGIGIPADCIDRVFDRFYRVEKSRSRSDGGSGLGLAIVKLAAEVHDGRVAVVSELGRGSTFSVLLPLPEVSAGPSFTVR